MKFLSALLAAGVLTGGMHARSLADIAKKKPLIGAVGSTSNPITAEEAPPT